MQNSIWKEVADDKPEEASQETVKYYMLHHAVVKEDKATTKFREVFDVSSHDDNSPSLNECLTLHTGPILNPKGGLGPHLA